MRILALSDAVSPVIYSPNFPGNLPPFDLVLAAGDLPGYLLEFVATKVKTQPVYVLGNHGNGYVRPADGSPMHLPGGCLNAHGRVVEVAGVLIAGVEGCLRYRPGPHQYRSAEMGYLTARMAPHLALNRLRKGRAVDVLLTHAPPRGPHALEDPPHRGVAAFNRFHRRWRPRLHVHGHVHLTGANAPREYVSEEGVRVVNAFAFTLIDLDRSV